ncbi:glycoside hydrolase, family 76 [Grosmannia clavigera kw1407]|uniref:Glycoside hydrolase, family 76 n=1 Tax=Grosmannia clavigera (strain kw1407 / UAMH 11150) TaxID=655863 RepID=F0XS63_GROCL|nr:glycoside hydrolase, family 76 [Grosmannia clavigera kw1407]EFW99636.1 glycoside hydrolase, family 76 [Grosmannia clavigera kw1407]
MIHDPIRIACAGLAVSVLFGTTAASSIPPGPFQRSAAGMTCSRSGSCAEAKAKPIFDVLDEFLDALRVLQGDYFELWLGTWPQAIDWTAAVTGTHVAGALSSLSSTLPVHDDDARAKENLITTYFSQLLSYYFGQDAFAIRNEAYDDMLWVVLGWLELIEFINYHTLIYLQSDVPATVASTIYPSQDVSEILRNQTWYGNLWTPAFSHRARIFWDLASRGWNTTLCGGGMLWNPRLEPYKNSITNELFIASSASMYLYFPGDPNPSPFSSDRDPRVRDPAKDQQGSREPHEKKHLQAALDAYDWLASSGMMNRQGLYIDGFHINGWSNASNPNTKCDVRNEMVYTYNQGVVLTGQVGLWKATADERFLDDGHALIQSVIRATGYDLGRDRPVDNIDALKPGQLPPWHGLGRAGVLEEQCDISGECSQDSQTFKGIYFHHLSAFCAPLDAVAAEESQTSVNHRNACVSYLGWIRHNAAAALATKDSDGKFGMWWTAGLLDISAASLDGMSPKWSSDSSCVDYRTYGVPDDTTWTSVPVQGAPAPDPYEEQRPLMGGSSRGATRAHRNGRRTTTRALADPNTRGRGRTVETQGGGLAVLRTLWEITNLANR